MPWVDRSDLEDVAQMALVEAGAKYDGRCPFGAFAYTAVRAAVITELRKLRFRDGNRDQMPDEVDIQPDAGNRLELYDALAALPPRQYQAVVLTYWGGNRSAECATDDDTPSGMTQNQVAAEMGISQQAVARLLDSAKKTLREVVKAGCQSHT
jgi:RNA polymerase sigma factor (sigma-70 family)